MLVNRLSFVAELLRVHEQPETGMWLLYIIITILSILAYKMGFALKLPILKSLLIYLFLILGATILTFLAVFLPIVEALILTVAVLTIYHVRKRFFSREETSKEET